MLTKIVERLDSINSFSKNIIRIGCAISFVLCIVGLSLIKYNTSTIHTVGMFTIGSSMVYTASMLFSQTVIGGLIIDFLGNMINPSE